MAKCEICGADTEPAPVCAECRARSAGADRRKWRRGPRVVVTFLILLAVVAAVFALAVVYFIRHTTVVTADRNGGRMEAPFGVITAGNNPQQLAKGIGLEPYPGAAGERGTQAEMQSSTMAAMTFRTGDSPEQVMRFYQARYPRATVRRQGTQWVLVQVDARDTFTIKAYPSSGHTVIAVNAVTP